MTDSMRPTTFPTARSDREEFPAGAVEKNRNSLPNSLPATRRQGTWPVPWSGAVGRDSTALRTTDPRLGRRLELLMIARVLGAHHPVPPGEVEPEIVAPLGMVQVVMRRGGQPAGPARAGEAGPGQLVPRMADRVARDLVAEEDEDRQRIDRRDPRNGEQQRRHVERFEHRLDP